MAKAPKFGVSNYKGFTRIKRPGRHAKKPNKKFSRKIYRLKQMGVFCRRKAPSHIS